MLEFAKYLKENFNEDTSISEKIIKERWDKVVAIIKEAFDDQYADKRTALHRIQNEFVDKKIAPSTIDVEFLKNNLDYVIEKVNSLDEGEIRIVINNDVQKGSGASAAGIELESSGKKRGRPSKKVVEEETEEAEEITDEKVVKVSVQDNKVIVEPSENTGLQKSEHEFENEEEVNSFVDSLEDLFTGFKVEKEESKKKEDSKEDEEAEEEFTPVKIELATEASKENTEDESGEETEEETEDAGEEPEDAGEETEDAGEEPEDAETINWEDIIDQEEEAEEEMLGFPGSNMYDLESLDLNKLVGKIIKVNESWYNVKSISENKEIIAINKEGKESKFTLDEIDEMEYEEEVEDEAEEECSCGEEECAAKKSDDAEENMSWPYFTLKNGKLVDEEGIELENTPEFNSVEEAEAWLEENNIRGNVKDAEECMMAPSPEEEMEDPEFEEEVVEPEAAEEEVEETLSFAKIANRYMEEDVLTPPNMVDTAKGLTSHPTQPPKKMEKTNTPPKMTPKKGPSAALTAKPSKPPKKMENPGKAPKSDKKAAPSAALTAKPGKPKQKIEKVKSPEIPAEYKKGGAKG